VTLTTSDTATAAHNQFPIGRRDEKNRVLTSPASGSYGNVIQDNAINANFDGINVSSPITGTLISGNTVNGNANVGVGIAAGSWANTVDGNTARGNGVCDLSDGNAGANTWTNNNFGVGCF
jgi:parallel beta-helix repeat protein